MFIIKCSIVRSPFMNKTKSFLFLLLFFSTVCTLTVAQEVIINERLESLNFLDQLPEEILSTKTVVIVKTLNDQQTGIRPEWKSIASIVQKGMAKSGIDAVAYYHFDDLLSGYESYHAFLDAFDGRDIKHAAFLLTDGSFYRLILLKLTDRQFLIQQNQNAWKIDGKDLSAIMEDVYRKAANSKIESTNLLIIETPEFGEMVHVIQKRRSDFYDLNFASETLAIPQFADSSEIAKVMLDYPYKWKIVPLGSDEKELRSQGLQYVLYYCHSTVESVRSLLEYPLGENQSAYVSEVIENGQTQVTTHTLNTNVYKFYIKHIYTQNVFIGKKWDPAKTWQDALRNYIFNMRHELVRN